LSKGYEIINNALEFASKAHSNQFRKGTNIPYIVHPVEVAMILQENGASSSVIASGLLHDVLEDTDVNVSRLHDKFGAKICETVIGASEILEDRMSIPWEIRKRHTINFLKTANRDIQLVSCADKLSNSRSMLKNHVEKGMDFWSIFNADFESQAWYYRELVNSLKGLSGCKMYSELVVTVEQLFGTLDNGIAK